MFYCKTIARIMQLIHSQNMYKFKMKLLHNKEKIFCSKTELLDERLTLSLAKLDMIKWLEFFM